jgi:hypothetical protein
VAWLLVGRLQICLEQYMQPRLLVRVLAASVFGSEADHMRRVRRLHISY